MAVQSNSRLCVPARTSWTLAGGGGISVSRYHKSEQQTCCIKRQICKTCTNTVRVYFNTCKWHSLHFMYMYCICDGGLQCESLCVVHMYYMWYRTIIHVQCESFVYKLWHHGLPPYLTVPYFLVPIPSTPYVHAGTNHSSTGASPWSNNIITIISLGIIGAWLPWAGI